MIVVVVDRLSKYDYFIELTHPYTSSKVTHIFSQHMMKLCMLPKDIMSNKNSTFTGKFW